MIRVLFVCYGNICRSPMAEFVLKDMINRRGIANEFEIASAATSDEECWNGRGNPVYPPAQDELKRHGIGVSGNELGLSKKRARQITTDDYDKWDLIIAMEQTNIRGILRIVGKDAENKVKLMLDFTDRPGDIADPWYTGDFGGVYRQIVTGCEGLLKHLGF